MHRRAVLTVLTLLALFAGIIGADTRAAERPPVMGRNAGISAGHPLTTAAAFEVLLKGGNAFDAGVAALLADAACRGAVYNIRINISSLEDKSRGAGLVAEANQLLARTKASVDQATAAVDKAIG